YEGANHVCYLPMDGPKNAKGFYDLVNPSLVLFVKYEFWYYYSFEAAKRKIPLLLVSGIFRASQPFFKFYGGFYRSILSHFSHLFVQEQSSLDLMKTIGLESKSSISGDTRFDRVISIVQDFEPIETVEHFSQGIKVLVAGSTWAEDDEELNHFLHTNPQVYAIIAPHEIIEDRLKECLKWYPNAMLYSEYHALFLEGEIPSHVQVLIVNNYGMLTRLYSYGTICLVGGGFGGDGVHNVLEAAVYGKPVLIGPIYDKYLEAVELVDNGGCISVENALELEAELVTLLEDASAYQEASVAAKNYVFAKAGATKTILDYIQANRLLTN
ncbi:MAG: 3-deoxy-D-manno-octulosonic acid transferase, partial [Sphingobacteriia bacterium 35-40-5]